MADRSGGRAVSEEDMRLLSQQARPSSGRAVSKEDTSLVSGSSGGRGMSSEDVYEVLGATGVGGAPQEGPRTSVSDADVVEAMGILNSGEAESDEDRAMSREVLRKATPAQSRMARKELGLQPKRSGGAVKKKKKASSSYMGGGKVYRGRSYAYGGRVAKYKG